MITTTAPAPLPVAPARRPSAEDGAVLIDRLLAEINPHENRLVDAVLDLRILCAAGIDANGCVRQLLRVRSILDGRHHAAFYRIRCWARWALRIEVRGSRTEDWVTRELPLDAARVDEIVNTALAALVPDGDAFPAEARIRFTFVPQRG